LKGVEVCKLQNNYRGTNIFSGTELLAVRFEVFQYCNYIYIYIYIYGELHCGLVGVTLPTLNVCSGVQLHVSA